MTPLLPPNESGIATHEKIKSYKEGWIEIEFSVQYEIIERREGAVSLEEMIENWDDYT